MSIASPAALLKTISENIPPTKALVSGNWPSWLKGKLIRNGPAMFELGSSSFNHWFDGLSMLHSFDFDGDGSVTYTGNFLETDQYRESKAAGRFVKDDFGTRAGANDPCQTIFHRFFSYFSQVIQGSSSAADNTCVNVVSVDGKWIAMTETSSVWQFDPANLEAQRKFDLYKSHPTLRKMATATAHPHATADGGMYDVGTTVGRRSYYQIFKSKIQEDSGKLVSEPLCALPASNEPSYYHSFGITEHYFVFVEMPLKWSMLTLATRRFHNYSFADSLHWLNDMPCRFRLVNRETNQEVNVVYESDPFFCFHHVNAFEDPENGQLVVDMVCYPDDRLILEYLKLKEMRSGRSAGESGRGSFRRFFLPLDVEGKQCKIREEILSKELSLELPRINHKFNGSPYRFAYGLGTTNDSILLNVVVKLDTDTKETKEWQEKGMVASEPVFVAAPEAKAEDQGVILSVLLSGDPEEKRPFLVVLDASTFEEVARAEVNCRIPTTFHGNFLAAKS